LRIASEHNHQKRKQTADQFHFIHQSNLLF